ncbi:response regulator transcription factor [Synechococcus sp. PCC 7336]|uniref:response regulator transcription factor n=1 Tax=Synechococcus sp. PCC 7336 TaxID=195250 RepID=UPI00034A21B7|nr:response regulator transcription factor [Synechococcus sp. PCC 7336]
MSTLIAEDDALYRQHVLELLEQHLSDCGPFHVASNGSDALDLANRHTPSFLLLDIQMPEMTGIDVARQVWNERPDTRIIFWSNFADEVYVRELHKIVPPQTVYGYLLKNSTDDKLLSAVMAVVQDEQCVIDREVRGVDSRSQNKITGLSDAEYEVLIDIALGLTDQAIASRRFLSRRGVTNRLRNLYDKLEVNNDQIESDEWGTTFSLRSRAIRLAFRRGLINLSLLDEEEKELDNWLSRYRLEPLD